LAGNKGYKNVVIKPVHNLVILTMQIIPFRLEDHRQTNKAANGWVLELLADLSEYLVELDLLVADHELTHVPDEQAFYVATV